VFASLQAAAAAARGKGQGAIRRQLKLDEDGVQHQQHEADGMADDVRNAGLQGLCLCACACVRVCVCVCQLEAVISAYCNDKLVVDAAQRRAGKYRHALHPSYPVTSQMILCLIL